MSFVAQSRRATMGSRLHVRLLLIGLLTALFALNSVDAYGPSLCGTGSVACTSPITPIPYIQYFSVVMPGKKTITAMSFNVAFNQTLYVKTSSTLGTQTIIPVSGAQNDGISTINTGANEYSSLPTAHFNLMGVASLSCDGTSVGSTFADMGSLMPPTNPANSEKIPAALTPFIGVFDIGASYLNVAGGNNYTGTETIYPNVISFWIATDLGALSSSALSTCLQAQTLQIIFNTVTSDPTKAYLCDQNGVPVVPSTFVPSVPSPAKLMQYCDNTAMQKVITLGNAAYTYFKSITENTPYVGGPNGGTAGAAAGLISSSIFNRNAWLGCTKLAQTFYTPSVATTSLNTAACSYDNTNFTGSTYSQYLSDPCCYAPLAYSKCCAASTKSFPYATIGSLNASVITSTCTAANADGIAGLVYAANNALKTASTVTSYDYNNLQRLFQGAIDSCWQKVQYSSCTSNSQCKYSNLCVLWTGQSRGTCYYPDGTAAATLIWASCVYDSSIPAYLATALNIWNIPSSYTADQKKAAFSTKFATLMTSTNCVGSAAVLYDQNNGLVYNYQIHTASNGAVIPYNQTGCLSKMGCNYNYWNGGSNNGDSVSCTATTNNNFGTISGSTFTSYSGGIVRGSNFCAFNCPTGVNCFESSNFPTCTAYFYSGGAAADCAFLGGTLIGGSTCTFSASTYAGCISSTFAVTPSPVLSNNFYWQQGMCVTSTASGSCSASTLTYDSSKVYYGAPSFSSATSNCQFPLYYSNNYTYAKLNCQNQSGTFFEGRAFFSGAFSTQSSCETGYCNIPSMRYSSAATCTSTSICSAPVSKCSVDSAQNPDVAVPACYNTSTSATQLTCLQQSASNSWITSFYSSGVCKLGGVATAASCVGSGASWLSCETYTSSSTCSAAAAAALASSSTASDAFLAKCQWGAFTSTNQAECTSSAGVCSDDDLDISATYINNGLGSCVSNGFAIDAFNNLYCPQSVNIGNVSNKYSLSTTQLGCKITSPNFLSPAACNTAVTEIGASDAKFTSGFVSGSFHIKSTSQSNCTADTKRFRCVSSVTGLTNNYAQSECNLCSFTWGSPYTWTPGTWRSGSMVQGSWLNRTWGPLNTISSSFDYTKANTFSNQLTSVYAADLVSDQFAKRFNVMSTILQKVACGCTGANTNCGLSTVSASVVGDQSSSSSGDISGSGVSISAAATGNSPATVQISTVANIPVVPVSGNRRRLAAATYATISISGVTYGTVISDGYGITVTSGSVSGAYTLCIPYSAAYANYNNVTYPTLDFANSVNNVASQALGISVTRDASLSYCGSVTSTGIYYAVARFAIPKSTSTPVVSAAFSQWSAASFGLSTLLAIACIMLLL